MVSSTPSTQVISRTIRLNIWNNIFPCSNWQFNFARQILASFRNGNLIGYQIHVKDSNGSAFHSNVTLNATTTSYLLTNLSVHHEYTVRAVAFTKMGLGPFSPPVGFKMDPSLIRFSKSTLSGMMTMHI